jgi:regulator of replication initiation timing
MDIQPENVLSIPDINSAWSEIVGSLLIAKLSLEKQIQQLRLENNALLSENKNLRSELNQAEANLLAVQGKQAIDKGQVIQE